jgi:outer membrane protein insertion porin family
MYYDTTVVVVNGREKRGGDQYRTTVNFYVKPGKQVRLGRITYDLKDSTLQRITKETLKESLLHKGEAFAKGPISGERDRLVELYRHNGYLKFNREEIIGLWDTVDVELLRPAIDPFEQIDQLKRLAARRDSLTANLEMRLRPNYDSAKLVKFYVGRVRIYPDFQPEYARNRADPLDTTIVAKEMLVIQSRDHKKFKPGIFPIYIYLKHDSIYSQRRHQRTINRLNQLQAWKVINVIAKPRDGQDTVDFDIELTPADQYVFDANFEASQNQTAVAGNLFGIGVNTGVQNRNLWKAANVSNLNFRYGVELGNKFIQTQQANFSYNIYFPRPIPKFKLAENIRDNINTVFSFNATNTERRELYNLTTVNGSWGYEFTRNRPRTNRSVTINIRIPNIEYTYLLKRDSLDTLIARNPSLNNIFNDGLIASVFNASYTLRKLSTNRPSVLSLGFEEAGLIAGLIPSRFLDSQLYRFIKFNAEYTKQFKWRKSSVVLRAFGGIGWELDVTKNPAKKATLPFFKQYFAGGPNSMRAWRLRRLGPGSVVKSFENTPERFGDVQLEFNVEYRWNLGSIAGIKLETALFADIGNVWFLKKMASDDPREVFNIGRLYEDLAVGVGTGFRLDFDYFIVRLDYAFKAKDPSPDTGHENDQNKWFPNIKPFNGQLQIGINYPFKL